MKKQIYRQFHDIEKRHWWFKGMYGACHDLLRRSVLRQFSGNTIAILDVGCGTGAWTERLSEYGGVIGSDNSSEALKICKSKDINNLVRANADSLPFSDKGFDLISALGLIEHVDNDTKLLTEIKRCLKPGGHAIILTSAYKFLWGEHDDLVYHKRRYTNGALRKAALASGLEIVKISYLNTFLFLPILIMRRLERILPKKANDEGISRDLQMPPFWLNGLLYVLLKIESGLLKWTAMPFGVSILLLARRAKND